MKGNMFLGYARGSVGDVTFSRSKGQQVARARNRQPANPRTIAQSMQRSLFANTVKFHSKGVQQLFKFAFEDRRPSESDYNAFMRHNINASVRISKFASESALYPAIGKWMMSYGSLRAVDLKHGGGPNNNKWFMAAPSANSNMTTYGDFADVLRSDYGLMQDDIITLVHITAIGCTAVNMPSIYEPSGAQPVQWTFYQFRLDSSSTESVAGMLTFDNGRIMFNRSDVSTDSYIQGFAVIFSRPRSEGLLVSTSYLIGNDAFETVFEAAQDSAYIEQVLNSWQTAEQAILQGSLIQSSEDMKNMVTEVRPALPSSATSIVCDLKRDGFYADTPAGTIVGEMMVAGRPCDIVVTTDGSTMGFEVTDNRITGEGMHSAGNHISWENADGQSISSIIIFDM